MSQGLPVMSSNSTALQDHLDETRVPQALVVLSLCPAIALGCVALQLYTRAFVLRRVFWEDYSIVAAMVVSLMLTGFMVSAFLNGSGRHMDAISHEQLVFQSRISPGVHLNYIASHMFLKLAIALRYTRISVMAFERRLCQVLVGIVVVGYVTMLVANLCRCIPFQAIWVPNIPGAKCLDTKTLFYTMQGHTLAMDFIILIVPLFILRHLTIPWRQRVLLVIVAGFGGIACIAGVLRMRVLRLSSTSHDKTWDSFYSAIYGAIEVNLGITCACVVTLRPLLRRWRWLSGGAAEKAPAELGLPTWKRRRVVDDKDHIPTADSTQVLTVSDDAELGAVDENGVGPSDSKRELVTASSVTVNGGDSCAGSTTAGSRSSESADSDIKGASPKSLPGSVTSFSRAFPLAN